MDEQIQTALKRIEAEESVRVLYACESGSRAWGFPSPDSDYDVRFIYAHPHDWYLAIDVEHRRDVIERPIADALDVAGWDIRKALRLFRASNGALLEWLHSPVRYRECGAFRDQLAALVATTFDRRGLCHHYAHMARGNARNFLGGDQVRLKKYLYVLRPLLAIRHVETTGALPPVVFRELVDTVAPEALVADIDTLLARKRRAGEHDTGPPIPALEAFIHDELGRHEAGFDDLDRPDIDTRPAVLDALNALFRRVVTGGA